jgi:hypothetical protein
MGTKQYPRIENVRPLPRRCLLVRFRNGITKIFDCDPLLRDPPFDQLRNDSMFRAVRVDPGGYGVSWTDEIDLSESEIWLKGVAAACPTRKE